MRLRTGRLATGAAVTLGLGFALACTFGPDTDTDTTDTDDVDGGCPAGMAASRDGAVNVTQFMVGSTTLIVGVDPTVDDPIYGPSVCVGESSARVLLYSDSLLAVVTLAGLDEGTYSPSGHVTVDYFGAEGNATFADAQWQTGTLTVGATDPLTFTLANGFAVSNEGYTLSIFLQGEVARP